MDFLTDPALLADFIGSAVRLAVPVAFAALGGVLAERSGTINIGLEGAMLSGAFGAAVGSFYTGSALGGIVGALFWAGISGFVLSLLTVRLRVNQLVAGIAVNLLCLGLTSFFARQVFGDDLGRAFVAGFEKWEVPLLSGIPLLGPIVFNQDALVYALYLLVPLSIWFLYRTGWGLNLRGTGENPKAADTAGVPVYALRTIALVGSGMLAGLGGAHMVLSQLRLFAEDMSAGKGYIALAAVILGRWNPWLAVSAALFFGLCDAAQLRLQFSNPTVPYQAFIILPYVASIIALIVFVGSSRQPESLGKAYDRESR